MSLVKRGSSRGSILCSLLVLGMRSFSSMAVEKVQPVMMNTNAISNNVFNVRLACREDIKAIRQCNLDNLPENYSEDFFRRHLATWPALSIIAESENRELLGYALGRIELSPDQPPKPTPVIGKVTPYRPSVYVGHVTSIAVHSPFRGLGVAKSLMQSLHTQLAKVHNVDKVSLHCRISNEPAIKLYSNFFSYIKADQVPKYYEDSEDAWLMTLSGLKDVADQQFELK